MPEDIGAATSEIEWRTSAVPVPYDEAVAGMEARVAAIRAGWQEIEIAAGLPDSDDFGAESSTALGSGGR